MKSKRKPALLLILLIFTGVIIVGGFVFTPWLKNLLSNWAKEKVITYVADNSAYKLTIDSLSIEGFTTVELHRVRLENKLTKEEFNKKEKFQTDWIRFETDKIFFREINWKNWISDKGIRMQEMILEHPFVYVYRDKRKPRAPYVVKPLPTKYLRDSKQVLTVPEIKIKNGIVEYEEVITDGIGKVNFTHLESTLEHFSTDTNYMAERPEMQMKTTALFLDKIKVDLEYKTEIKDKMDHFKLKGSISSFPASYMNQFLEPLAKFKIKSGVINDLQFQLDADKNKAQGTLEMKYENLETIVMKKDDPSEESKLKTWLANVFIKDENVKGSSNSDYRKGKIAYERKKNFSIFHYWLNSVKSGVFDVVTDVDVQKLKEISKK